MKILLSFLFGLLIAIFSLQSYGQSCNGSLGDPVKKTDFGTGGAPFGQPLPTGVTNYQYIAASPEDGQYTIVQTTRDLNPGWITTGDHTGGGYMMLINATKNSSPDQKGIFYQQQIDDLCAGTIYEFAVWVRNILRGTGLKPNLTLSIEAPDGTQLAPQFNTGDIPEGGPWIQYPMLFTAKTSTVIIKMSNNGPGGGGNDLVIDDITFRPCGPLYNVSFTTTGFSSEVGCIAKPKTYALKSNLQPGYAKQWQVNNGSGWVDITGETGNDYTFTQPTTAGNYQYRLTAALPGNINSPNCRYVSNIASLKVDDLPNPVIHYTPVCEGDVLSIKATDGVKFSWTGPNNYIKISGDELLIPNVTTAASGDYYVTVTSAGGCETIKRIPVQILPKPVAAATGGGHICEGTGAQLNASGGTIYSWLPTTGLSDPTIANPIATPTENTTYTVTVSNGVCSSTADVTVSVLKPPLANAGADVIMNEENPAKLHGSVGGTNIRYFWEPATYLSSSTVLDPLVTAPHDINYVLHVVSDECGEKTDTVFIRVYKKITVYNTFTPNNDGKNDTWTVEALETYPESTVKVFNRQGSIVYQSKGYATPWNGRIKNEQLPTGTYYYVIDLKNGRVYSGWVFLAR